MHESPHESPRLIQVRLGFGFHLHVLVLALNKSVVGLTTRVETTECFESLFVTALHDQPSE